MRFYDIALFIFIFNLSLGFLSTAISSYTDYSIGGLEGFGSADVTAAEGKITGQISDTENPIFAELNFLIENVRLAIAGISTMISFLAKATVFFPVMWYQISAPYVGDSQVWGAFIGLLSVPFYLIYVFGIIQWASGRSAKDTQ